MPLGKVEQIWLKDVLGKTGFLRFLSSQEIAQLHDKMHVITYEEGDRIIREGSSGGAFYILVRGKVTVMKEAMDGPDIPVAEISSGSYFGEMALISATPRTTSIVADDDVKVFSIGKKDFADIFMNNHQIRKILEKQSEARSKDTRKKAKKGGYYKKGKPGDAPEIPIGQRIVGKFRELVAPGERASYKTRLIDDPDVEKQVSKIKSMIEENNADEWVVYRSKRDIT